MTYSIIIKNGLIFDGYGNSPIQSDIGISSDKIKKIGNLSKEKAETIIDASDKYVSPGFIDLTTHSDTHWTLFSQPSQESFIRQGVTTIIGGHGGSSLAPLVKGEDIETIQKWTDVSKININWQGMAEFLDELERHPIGVNFGTLVGYGTIRRGVIRNGREAANNEETLNQMKYLLERSLKEGAFGFSTNLGTNHQKSAPDEEVENLLKVARDFNVITSHHLENEGKEILPAISRIIALTRNSGVHSHINHFKALGKTAWDFFPSALTMIEEAQKGGAKMTCDFFPYTKTGSDLYLLLPEWMREGNKDRILELIKSGQKENLIQAIKELTLHYDKIIIASTRLDLNAAGKTIETLSRSSGRSPEEIILDLLNVNDLQVAIFNEAILEDNIDLVAEKKYSMVASDGVGYAADFRSKTDLPHPRSFGAFSRVFSKLVKEKNILTWEGAIYKMTGLPAKTISIKDRGIIEEGAYADIVVFNPETITDSADYSDPYQPPQGMEYVLINGEIALKENTITSAGRGYILRQQYAQKAFR